MSKFELFLIIGACLTPFIALIFILPKRKKQKTPPPTTSYVKDKPADKPEVKPETKTAEVKPVQKKVSKSDCSDGNWGYVYFYFC